MSSNYERTLKSNTFDEDIKNYTIQDIYDLLNITSANPTDTQINKAIDTLSSKMKKEGNYDIVHFLSAARIKVIQDLRDNQFHKTFSIRANGGEDEEDEDDGNEEEDGEDDEDDGNEEDDEDEDENPDVDVPVDEDHGDYDHMNDDINEEYGIDESYKKNNYFNMVNQGIDKIYKNTTQGPYEKDENVYGYSDGNDDVKEIAEDEYFSDPDNGKFITKNNVSTDIKNTYELPFVKGTVNPLLATTVKRSIVVDSYYRQTPLDTNNTSFLFNLSYELRYIIGMQLYSIQIPTTWNNIDPLLGNSLFKINGNVYSIPAGYYTINTLLTAINTLVHVNFPTITFSLSSVSRIQVVNTSTSVVYTITFYDPAGMSTGGITDINAAKNKNLGWTLGFREDTILVPVNSGTIDGLVTGVQPDLSGSKYFILAVDDFNNNHLTDFLVNSSSANLQNDAFAIIPLKDIHPPVPYVDYDSNLEIFKRNYFGPVNISKLKVTLYDDRGNIVNLNQQDWSFTLIVEQMYKN